MKEKLKYLIPFIPVIGIILIFSLNPKYLIVKYKGEGYENSNSVLSNIWVFGLSALFQAIIVFFLFVLLMNLK